MTQTDALVAEHARALAQVVSLQGDLREMIAASESSNADDEHDPEGATVAFERAQVSALLAAARRRLDDAEQALDARRAGHYGNCLSCDQPIGPERLAARPAARTCIACARQTRR